MDIYMNIGMCFRSWSLLPRIQAKRQSLSGLPQTSITSPPLSGHTGGKVRHWRMFKNILEMDCAHFTACMKWIEVVPCPSFCLCVDNVHQVCDSSHLILVAQSFCYVSCFGFHTVAHTQPLRWRPSWRHAACHWQCGHVACWYLFGSYTTQ